MPRSDRRVLEARGRLNDLEPVGVIDIGSNSVRLVVYEGLTRSPAPLFNEKVLCGLGRSVASRGALGDEAKDRALNAMTRFRAIAEILRVRELHVLATAAVREAVDGPEFIEASARICGVKVRVLTGQEEAELAAAGIMMGFNDANGLAGDLGGGSLELIDVRHTDLIGATTLPLGGLRLIDTSGGDLDKARDIVDKALAKVDWLASGRNRPFYAVGGTWRALSRLHMAESNYPLHVTHGYRIRTPDAIEFCGKLARNKRLASLKGVDGVSGARREVLPYGALVLEGLLKHVKPSELVLSVFGIREGLLYRLLPEAERQRDPLMAFCLDYARLRSRSPAHAQELCTWTDGLFSKNGADETAEERRLRHAACLLSDINWRAESDYRGELSLNIIARSASSGTDHQGRVFLALAVYFRHTNQSPEGFGQGLIGLVSKRAIKRAKIVGAAVRTAHMVSIGVDGILDKCSLSFSGDELIMQIPRACAHLDGERLRRRFSTLANLVDRKPRIEFAN